MQSAQDGYTASKTLVSSPPGGVHHAETEFLASAVQQHVIKKRATWALEGREGGRMQREWDWFTKSESCVECRPCAGAPNRLSGLGWTIGMEKSRSTGLWR